MVAANRHGSSPSNEDMERLIDDAIQRFKEIAMKAGVSGAYHGLCQCLICQVTAEYETQATTLCMAAAWAVTGEPAMQEELRVFTEALVRKYTPPG